MNNLQLIQMHIRPNSQMLKMFYLHALSRYTLINFSAALNKLPSESILHYLLLLQVCSNQRLYI